MYNMYDEEDDGENGNKEKNEENARIKEKMNSLRHKMENLSIAKKVATCVLLSKAVAWLTWGLWLTFEIRTIFLMIEIKFE